MMICNFSGEESKAIYSFKSRMCLKEEMECANPPYIVSLRKIIKIMRNFLCKIRWHAYFPFYHPHWQFLENDGLSNHVRCGWCGYEGMIDSLGNLF